MIWRDVVRYCERIKEIAGSLRGKFIVAFVIHIIEVTKNPQLIVADLVLDRRITAPAFLFRIRAREGVKVKARKDASRRPWTASGVNIIACRNESVGKIRRRAKDIRPG